MLRNESNRTGAVARVVALGWLMVLVAGCHTAAPLVAGDAWSRPRAGAALYDIDAGRSRLRVLVYRAGPMAALGHDHVIQNRALSGWVDPAASATDAGFYLQIPVAEFSVDEEAARAEEGADFAEEVSAEAKSGTRHNLLSAALLNAAVYPVIAIRGTDIHGTDIHGTDIHGTGTRYAATVQIAIAGHVSTQTISFDVSRSADLLTATAEFPLRQSALGLTPFSVMMGALRVEDQIRVKLKLVAVPR